MSHLRAVLWRIWRASIFSTLLFPVFHIIRACSWLVPRDENIWLFYAWDGFRFSDNAKYLFLYVHANRKDVRPIWLTRSRSILHALRARGYRTEMVRSFRGLYYTLHAKLLIHDGVVVPPVSYWISGGLCSVDLWHGCPLKRIGLECTLTSFERWLTSRKLIHAWLVLSRPWTVRTEGYLVAPGKMWKDIYSDAFKISTERLWIGGHPRNEALVRPVRDSDIGTDMWQLARMRANKAANDKTIVYMPTFRNRVHNPLLNADRGFGELDHFLGDHHASLFIKFHHEKETAGVPYSHIHFVASSSDAYPLLRHADVLMTDYSSVFFDFLLTGRPIVFFPFDLQNYIRNERDLYFDYDRMTPGEKAYTLEELMKCLGKVLAGHDAYRRERQELLKRVFDHETTRVCVEMCEKLRRISDAPTCNITFKT
ncbi:MAG: CDP-glycerol glycerophosphotransferase family protein [Candidatus Peribacteraceae bacterium]|nr:CDP-glycerol glycerophosphotransferase family protein [Candidatus Peribacteraceae bacterium]MDD5740306.1 CDP-glycerol glycerophosphotransferase family protein [Candidatus Peribacteraceae bacterium]